MKQYANEQDAIVAEFKSYMYKAIVNCTHNVTRKVTHNEKINGGISLEALDEKRFGEFMTAEDEHSFEDGIELEITNMRIRINDDLIRILLTGLTEREAQALILHMSMDAEYEVKYAEAQSQLEYYEKQVQGDDSLRKRIEGFRKTLTQNQVLEEFDRAVFESIVEKVIVGGYDDDGNADPYKVTFIYKTGFKDSFDHAKTKFGPKSKKSDENVSSNSSVHQENQC